MDLKVFTFSGAWGLKSTGPFALKLLRWLDVAGVPYRQVLEDNPGKGPKRKNPWIELDGKSIGDTEVVIDLLARRIGFDIDAGLGARERALSHAVRRMLEEHFHQVLEWELFVHPAGSAYIREAVGAVLPPLLAGPIAGRFRGHFGKQLMARGIARHPPEVIAAKGKADLAALEALLENAPFLCGDRPSMGDIAAYGLLAPMAKWPMRTPVADYLKSRALLIAYVDRVGALGPARARDGTIPVATAA
jgi:glutathione S-transferase